ncbi:MAG: GNAT family N-acetyltransferase [Pseudomarimonas sp.]
MKTRIAAVQDIGAVAELFDAYRQFYEEAADLTLATQFITERMRNNESVILVAEDDGTGLLGFCQLYPTFCSVEARPIYVLYDLFVGSAHRKSGAGRQLMLAAEAHARQQGRLRLKLSTAINNLPAQALYESLGWQREQEFYAYNRSLS